MYLKLDKLCLEPFYTLRPPDGEDLSMSSGTDSRPPSPSGYRTRVCGPHTDGSTTRPPLSSNAEFKVSGNEKNVSKLSQRTFLINN